MSIIGSNILAGASGQGGEYTIKESLRFNASQSSYLSWTPASAGNRTTWTWSGWVKRGTLTSSQGLFGAKQGYSSTSRSLFKLDNSDNTLAFLIYDNINGYSCLMNTGIPLLRDPSAWYHIVIAYDSTQATASNRVKIYWNNKQYTFSGSPIYPSLNLARDFNASVSHYMGADLYSSASYLDGYLTEVNFIDGQALDPSSFGEFDSVTGVWKPVKYTGTYGTNGFYLPMQLDNTVEGFNTVTYIGTGSKQKISGVGFSPDLIWMKSRTSAVSHVLIDSVRGVKGALSSNNTAAEYTESANNGVLSFDTDGFTVGNDGNYTSYNSSGQNIVAWCWDAGNTTVSNTDGSITSSVRANPAYGFSVVTYTGTGANATVGHGLGTAPSMVIVKQRSTATSWPVYHSGLTSAATVINLNLTRGEEAPNSVFWNNTAPTSTVFSLGTGTDANASGATAVAYCFSEVAGYSKFGSYTGTGASGNTVTTGFKPAFVMVKNTSRIENWAMLDSTRTGNVTDIDDYLIANGSDTEVKGSAAIGVDFTDTGFTIQTTGDVINRSGDTYIYMAFADTREYAYWLDDSGNNNDWQPNGGITTESTVTDTPTPYADGGNYAVLNPLKQGSAVTVSNGNLRAVGTGAAWGTVLSSIGMTSGKWYCEVTVTANSNSQMFGICQETATLTTHVGASSVGYGYYAGGDKYNNGVPASYGASYTANDVIGIAYDADAGSLTFYKNNASQGVAYSGLSTTATWFFAVSAYNTNNTNDINFGQRPFAYTPPTGFLPLHTGNLPDSAIVDGSEYFNTVLYTGNISGASVTGVGFQPDFVWAKNRSAVNNHELIDAVRGGSSALFSNVTNAEATQQRISSFDSDGWTYTINSNSALANPYVGWTWKANGAGVSNTDGSITSTVSANPTAGFSIVTYTGTGANATVGHGLGVAPKLILFKNRASTNAWCVYHSSISPANFLQFDTSAKLSATTYPMFGTTPTAATSTVFSIGTNPQTNAASTFVAYCFAEVEGYSKFGSYTGNGSADGTFVYTGFRPRWLLIKNTTGYSWILKDTARDTRNVAGFTLVPNASAADSAAGNNPTDFLSNGFKLREGSVSINSSGTTYIYMAFAENPFKNSLAR